MTQTFTEQDFMDEPSFMAFMSKRAFTFPENKPATHYVLDDGRFWNIAEARFEETLPENAVTSSCNDKQGNSSLEGLIECLKFYNFPLGELTPPEEVQKSYIDAIQKRLDEFAQTRGYDNIFTVCSYYGSKNEKFSAEAKRCIDLRDATWEKCYQILDDVNNGNREIPTLEQVISELPVLTWE